MKEEAKRDQGLALKALESEDSDMDFEKIAIVTQSLRNSSRRLKAISRKDVPRSHETMIMISFQDASDVKNLITL